MITSVNTKGAQGFTIIEVLLVLSITGLLMLMSFFGQGSIRTQSQFRDSAEEFRASLESIKDQSTTGVAPGEKGCKDIDTVTSGNDASCVINGRVVGFTANSDTYTIYPIFGSGQRDPTLPTPVPSPSGPVTNPQVGNNFKQEKKLLWGTKIYIDPSDNPVISPRKVGFIRHAETGKLGTYIIKRNSLLSSPSSYNDSNSKHIIKLIGVDCDRAEIILNDPANTIRLEFKDKAC